MLEDFFFNSAFFNTTWVALIVQPANLTPHLGICQSILVMYCPLALTTCDQMKHFTFCQVLSFLSSYLLNDKDISSKSFTSLSFFLLSKENISYIAFTVIASKATIITYNSGQIYLEKVGPNTGRVKRLTIFWYVLVYGTYIT